ncbi:DNA damage-binding protein CMR1 like [Verticillium longisporum]|uniref:DNA damage-binding protein CMR1 n=1 Tax=Verticillium longisporum TaxID=100787 RepID=A0A8I2ZRD7_VERLO|nr:DNA damage-binding protein CMR1 like [Verticillium longisporum]
MPVTRRSTGRTEVKAKPQYKEESDSETDELTRDEAAPEPESPPVPVKKEAPATMSAFEKRRLENIAANQALLKDISATASKILPASKPTPTRASKPSKRSKDAPVKREPTMATRRSSRVAGLGPDKDDAKRAFEDTALESPLERAKRMRFSGDLNLGDALVEGKKWSASLEGLQGLKGLSRGAQPGQRTFTEDDIKNTTDKDLKDLRLRMDGLKLYEGWMPNTIKITPQRVYSLGFHPTEDKPVVFAGDKEGAIGVFDASQKAPEPPEDEDEEWDEPDPIISAFKFHTKTASAFVFSPADDNAVYTSSYDSTIRKLDLEKGMSVQVFAPDDVMEDMPMSAMEMPTNDSNLIYFSTLHGGFGRHDIRTPSGEHEVWSLSDNKIGGFSLHPLQPHLVATASLDRTMKIWDLRKITGKGDLQHPALLGEHESRLSVSHASWSPAGHLATSSYDDTIKIYDFTTASTWAPGHDIGADNMGPAVQVKHNNQTGRWVTILKPKWQLQPRDGIQKFTIGNMNRFVDVFAADGEQIAQLDGDGITAVPAVAHFHPTLDWVAGGNGSGKLTLWM